jgi:hypothetical protein
MSEFPRDEVVQHFRRWRAATDRRDLAAMAPMLAVDAKGGNSYFGILDGRDAIMNFVEKRWPAAVPNRSVWHVIDGARVVNKWRETLPGTPPDGTDYHYVGISEFIYAGNGEWSFMYGIPDAVGLGEVHKRWTADGHAEEYPKLYSD